MSTYDFFFEEDIEEEGEGTYLRPSNASAKLAASTTSTSTMPTIISTTQPKNTSKKPKRRGYPLQRHLSFLLGCLNHFLTGTVFRPNHTVTTTSPHFPIRSLETLREHPAELLAPFLLGDDDPLVEHYASPMVTKQRGLVRRNKKLFSLSLLKEILERVNIDLINVTTPFLSHRIMNDDEELIRLLDYSIKQKIINLTSGTFRDESIKTSGISWTGLLHYAMDWVSDMVNDPSVKLSVKTLPHLDTENTELAQDEQLMLGQWRIHEVGVRDPFLPERNESESGFLLLERLTLSIQERLGLEMIPINTDNSAHERIRSLLSFYAHELTLPILIDPMDLLLRPSQASIIAPYLLLIANRVQSIERQSHVLTKLNIDFNKLTNPLTDIELLTVQLKMYSEALAHKTEECLVLERREQQWRVRTSNAVEESRKNEERISVLKETNRELGLAMKERGAEVLELKQRCRTSNGQSFVASKRIQELERMISESEIDITQLSENVLSYQEDITSLRNDKVNLQSQLVEALGRVGEANEEIGSLKQGMIALRKMNAFFKDSLDRLTALPSIVSDLSDGEDSDNEDEEDLLSF